MKSARNDQGDSLGDGTVDEGRIGRRGDGRGCTFQADGWGDGRGSGWGDGVGGGWGDAWSDAGEQISLPDGPQ